MWQGESLATTPSDPLNSSRSSPPIISLDTKQIVYIYIYLNLNYFFFWCWPDGADGRQVVNRDERIDLDIE